ncbi:uncharacterized protein LOC144473008 isoform X3 [Augochlora pura]
MKFILIPFFLATNVTVNDPAKWQYGLVSRFDANLTFTWLDTGKIELSAEVICRQRSINELMCSINKMETWIGPVMKQMGTEPEFLIEFSQRGVESFQFQRMIDRTRLNRVRSIFQQLSVGVDLLRHANALPAFVARENNVLGDCDTLFTVVQHGEEDGCFASNCDRQRGYQLNVLSLPEQRPGATVVIEKRYDRNRCKNNGEVGGDGTVFSEVRQDRTRTKIHIGSNTFTSQTEMSRKMKAVKMNQDFIGQSYIRVELTGIEPATEELPNLTFEHVASLPYGDMLEHNFL